MQEKELEKWKCQVKDLESENFIKEQTIRQLQEQTLVSGGVIAIQYFGIVKNYILQHDK